MKARKSPIRTKRVALGLRVAEVAAMTGITVQALWLIETGRTQTPTLPVARRLAEVLQSTVDDLFPPVPERKAA